jgi:hypothetical protein
MFYSYILYIKCGPAMGQNLYSKDNEIHNFGRSLPAVHHHVFSFLYIRVVSEKEYFSKLVNFYTFCPASNAPWRAGVLKFTILVPLVPKMHHTRFEKKWSSGYQEVTNVLLLTYFITDHFGPTQIPKRFTLRSSYLQFW